MHVEFRSPEQDRAAGRAAQAIGQNIGFAHRAKVTHQMERGLIGHRQGHGIGNRKRETGPLQQATQVAHLPHRRDPRTEPACDLGLGFREYGAQLLQGLTAEERSDHHAVGLQRVSTLDQLAYRVIRPMQGQCVNDEVMRSVRQVEPVGIRYRGVAEPVLPWRRPTGDNNRIGKPPVNLFQPILDFVGDRLLQEQSRSPRQTACAGSPGEERGSIKQLWRGGGHGRPCRGADKMLPAAIRAIYPPRCMGCGDPADRDHALCGPCWRETPFIVGLVCDLCGTSLPGQGDSSDGLLCDDCLQVARPWKKGRAALQYEGRGRRFALQLKHGDRTELARPLAAWMAAAARPLVAGPVTVVPVPLHRMRLLGRRFNQSALLAQRVAQSLGQPACLDALIRTRPTPSLGRMTREERFRTLQDAVAVSPRRAGRLTGQDILLVDDVMTTGATLAAATEALHAAGVRSVCVVTLARAAKAL